MCKSLKADDSSRRESAAARADPFPAILAQLKNLGYLWTKGLILFLDSRRFCKRTPFLWWSFGMGDSSSRRLRSLKVILIGYGVWHGIPPPELKEFHLFLLPVVAIRPFVYGSNVPHLARGTARFYFICKYVRWLITRVGHVVLALNIDGIISVLWKLFIELLVLLLWCFHEIFGIG